MLCAKLTLVLLIWLVADMARAVAQPYGPPPTPPGMLTDRPEYCGHLAGEWAAEQQVRPPPPPYARMLAAQGREMCERGHIRAGILRLRRALVILRSGDG